MLYPVLCLFVTEKAIKMVGYENLELIFTYKKSEYLTFENKIQINVS